MSFSDHIAIINPLFPPCATTANLDSLLLLFNDVSSMSAMCFHSVNKPNHCEARSDCHIALYYILLSSSGLWHLSYYVGLAQNEKSSDPDQIR